VVARVLRGESTTPPPKAKTATSRATALWTVVMGLGTAMLIIGSLDTVSAWVGVDVSDRLQLFEGINQHFRQLMVPTMGIGSVTVGFMGRGSRRYVSGLAWIFWTLAAGHLFLLVYYLSRVPSSLDAPSVAVHTLVRAVVYILAYGWTAYYLWVQTRVQGWPSRPG